MWYTKIRKERINKYEYSNRITRSNSDGKFNN